MSSAIERNRQSENEKREKERKRENRTEAHSPTMYLKLQYRDEGITNPIY